jgi:ornithine carbamoyltransferase
MTVDFLKKIRFPETLFAQEVDGEMVLLDMRSENYYGLDAVATDIWRLLQEERNLEETVEALLEIYEVEESQLRRDLETFVSGLVEQGLAELV